MGDVDSLWFDRAPNGGGIACLRFVSGAVGVLHCTSGKSGTSPNERFEVIGNGASVVVDNVIRLTHYRPGKRGHGGPGVRAARRTSSARTSKVRCTGSRSLTWDSCTT